MHGIGYVLSYAPKLDESLVERVSR